MPSVIIHQSGHVAVRAPVGDRTTIGRDPDNSIVIDHGSVSRHHARLAAGAAGLVITDLQSTHGMRFGGEPVAERLLRDGDRFQLGSVVLEFEEHDAPASDEITVHAAPGEPSSDEARRLAVLYDLSRAVGSLEDREAVAGDLLRGAAAALGCERAVVELRDGGAPRRIVEIRPPAGREALILSQTVLDAVLVRRERILIRGRQTAQAPSLVAQGVRAAMAVPVASARALLGFIYVDDRTRSDHFTLAELDFLTALAHLLAAALEQAGERRRLECLAEAARDLDGAEIAGASEPVARLRAEVQRYASAGDTPVLILGESGTGKELVARRLHALSPRAGGPFVAVNCAALPDTMIESELFGHERGAFTGAVRAHRGKLALADGGTLFLDEVGDLSPGAQAKLLRAIESGEVQPLGAEQTLEVHTRVLAATHKRLEEEIEARRFRADLYYRLAVGVVKVPPLRERGDDVLVLADLFRERYAAQLGRRIDGFSPAVRATLKGYGWPGNVRQLRNEIERAVILAEGRTIEALSVGAAVPAPQTLDEAERLHIEAALRVNEGNVKATAQAIGISRGMLYRKMIKHGLTQE